MITIQDTPHTPYILYSVFDHDPAVRDYVRSPDGLSDFWTREQLFDAIQTYDTVSIMVWNGFIYVNEII